jgi:hypothetical protein
MSCANFRIPSCPQALNKKRWNSSFHGKRVHKLRKQHNPAGTDERKEKEGQVQSLREVSTCLLTHLPDICNIPVSFQHQTPTLQPTKPRAGNLTSPHSAKHF